MVPRVMVDVPAERRMSALRGQGVNGDISACPPYGSLVVIPDLIRNPEVPGDPGFRGCRKTRPGSLSVIPSKAGIP